MKLKKLLKTRLVSLLALLVVAASTINSTRTMAAQDIDIKFIEIPGGEFEMGNHHGDGYSNELPIHAVYVDSFYMGK